ncbi:MAG: tetratricopeptide repeat protein, partial [Acidobacteriota bacterium]
ESLRPSQIDVVDLKRDAENALSKGEPQKAVEFALQANRRTPDDLESYSLLVRAYLKLGKIEEAEKQAQWMLDLRTENPLSLLRAADVREAIGQWDGAMALLNDAYGRVQTPREKAEILLHGASIQRKAGRPESAERLTEQAHKLVPEESK